MRASRPSAAVSGSRDRSAIQVGLPVGAEQSVPVEVDHREIAVCVEMVDEMKLLHAPEPAKALQQRSLNVIRLVEIDMRIERGCGGRRHGKEQPERQEKECRQPGQDGRYEEEGRVVALL